MKLFTWAKKKWDSLLGRSKNTTPFVWDTPADGEALLRRLFPMVRGTFQKPNPHRRGDLSGRVAYRAMRGRRNIYVTR